LKTQEEEEESRTTWISWPEIWRLQALRLEIRRRRRFELVSVTYISLHLRYRPSSLSSSSRLSPSPSAGTTLTNPFAHQWLLENYMSSPQTTIQRTSMYASYVSVCEAHEVKVSFVPLLQVATLEWID